MRTPLRVLASVLLLAIATTASAAESCDRACLGGLMTQYIDALVAHDSSRLMLAPNARITEDSKSIKLGEGIWKTATAKGAFRQDYLDVRKQVAAAHFVVLEGQNQALCSVLLHVKDGKIAGIESLIAHVTAESRFQPKELGQPIKGFMDAVPKSQKQSRESMIKTALLYPEGLRVGSFIDGGTPFSSEAYRVENGAILAGAGCIRPSDCGLYEQNLLMHPSIIANIAAVDEENGVVVLWMNFGHTGNSYGEGNSLITFEAFKVWGGQIHSINAFFKGMPIATSRFWPSADPIPK